MKRSLSFIFLLLSCCVFSQPSIHDQEIMQIKGNSLVTGSTKRRGLTFVLSSGYHPQTFYYSCWAAFWIPYQKIMVELQIFPFHFGGKSGTNELVVQGHNEKTMIYMYKL